MLPSDAFAELLLLSPRLNESMYVNGFPVLAGVLRFGMRPRATAVGIAAVEACRLVDGVAVVDRRCSVLANILIS